MNADRNLLFGILALQMDFISRDALVAAMYTWAQDKSQPLGQILQVQGALRADHRTLLESMVEAHLQAHGGDARQSLAALRFTGPEWQNLSRLADTDLQATLTHLSAICRTDIDEPGPAGTPSPPPEMRFQVLRLHARGGLGEVSLARDTELGRDVALKEIQQRYANSPTYRARFLREAEVTGGLEHPGIVPVYGLGAYPDGRPFYAMRFIRGTTLKEAADAFHQADRARRDPQERNLALRDLLGRFVDACNAVAYAHSRGVLHRDLKPGNIMLGKYGETLVVDWGLAKIVGQTDGAGATSEEPLRPTPGTESGLTEMGVVIGTHGYMSPEQATGQIDRLGPASDVYSLGATLFHLLTSRPPHATPFPVQGAEETKKATAVATGTAPGGPIGEAARPTRVKPAVPAALEAVCRKALAPQPENRYATLRALAEDVERWLADEPVSAYREPWRTRLGRWARMHKALVTGVAALLLTAVVALALGLGLVNRAREQTENARRRTRLALDAMSSEVIDDWLARQPQLDDKQRKFLENALAYYEEFTAESGGSEAARAGVAEAYLRVGLIHSRLGERQAAEAAYQRAQEHFARLAADFPVVRHYRQNWALSLNKLGGLRSEMNRPSAAEVDWNATLDLRKRLAAESPDEAEYRHDLSGTYNNLGLLRQAAGRPEEAEANFRAALDLQKQLPNLPEYRRSLSTTYNSLGQFLRDKVQPKEAEEAYRAALTIQKQLVDAFPNVPEYQQFLAASYFNLGTLLPDLYLFADAEAAHRAALELRQRLAAVFPGVPKYRQNVADSLNSLGDVLTLLDRLPEAEEMYRAAIVLRRQLVAELHDAPEPRRDLAASSRSRGNVLLALDRGPEAAAACREALELNKRLHNDFPKNPDYQRELATSHMRLGGCFEKTRPNDAGAEYRAARDLTERLVTDFSTKHEYRQDLAWIYTRLGFVFNALSQSKEAEAALRVALDRRKQLVTDFGAAPAYKREAAESHYDLGDLLLDLGRQPEAEAEYHAALDLCQELATAFPKVSYYEHGVACTLDNLATLSLKRKDVPEARHLVEKARPHHQAALKDKPGDADYRKAFGKHLRSRTDILLMLGDHAAASATAAELAAFASQSAKEAHDAACYLARCVKLAQTDPKLTETLRKERAQAYGDRAMHLLRKAVDRGYKDVANLKTEADLEPLRSRADFPQLITDLNKGAKK
jgi:serine/threonine-protein kinase